MDMPIMAPTTACELETGTNGIVGKPRFNKNVSRPRDANINKTIECAITAIKAVVAERLPSCDPTVSITFREYVNTPRPIDKPPNSKSCWAELIVKFPSSRDGNGCTGIKTPTTFAILFAPKA